MAIEAVGKRGTGDASRLERPPAPAGTTPIGWRNRRNPRNDLDLSTGAQAPMYARGRTHGKGSHPDAAREVRGPCEEPTQPV